MKYAVRIENEIISRGVQSLLFENGFKWRGKSGESFFNLTRFPFCITIKDDKELGWCNEAYYREEGCKIIDPESLINAIKKPITEFKLNNEHTAIIDPNTETVKVGCQTFTFAKVRELAGKLEGN